MRSREGLGRNAWLRAPVLVTLGFGLAIVAGTVLLGLPSAVAAGHPPLRLDQALFTATSAVCVTGLTVVSTARELSGFGQGVVLALLQLGGIGVMTLAVLVFESLRGAVATESGEVLETTLGGEKWLGHPRRALGLVLGSTLALEALGFLALWPALRGEPEAAWKALFLAVSAFCNAGFDNLENGLSPYAGSWAVGLPLLLLWLAGGLGFVVPAALLRRMLRNGRKHRLAAGARLILILGGLFALAGPALYALCESFGGAMSGRDPSEQLMLALFQGNTTRTAGFSMVDLAEARRITLVTMIPLMLLGGAPGGTAGGMKTTTAWLFLATIWARIRGRRDVVVLGRSLPQAIIRRAIMICFLVVGLHALLVVWLTACEDPARFRFEDLAFEAASAIGTVGLSTGLTAELGGPSRLALVLAMFIGRLGPLTLVYAVFRQAPESPLRLPHAEFPVG